ncbi:MAG TPA: amidohydrolase family protein [Ramlibacter sp.]|nr:amidohydrolase family protein [Ramlibacter sp.]
MSGGLPVGACDCHFHVFDVARYPYGIGRHYTPADAPLAGYLALCTLLGVDRSVLVHPTVFGADHSSFEAILESQGPRMRGVAVVSPDTPDDDIARWHSLGACGTRITTVFTGDPDLGAIRRIAAKVKPFGWHVQLLVDLVQRPQLVSQVHGMGVEVVVDHMGHHATAELLHSPGLANLLSLLADGVAWVKASAPYRLSPHSHDDPAIQRLVQAFARANPQRLVWGTDWPHPNSPHAVPADECLVSLLADWLPDAALRKAVLVDNPTQLYWAGAARA